ncbi:hypothetical protein AB0G79_02405 [Streptomyces sp. NPDC020807]|uniref:hypothetical protein n=1 Tax=Streptomyces sp. NPDC020807 TaxID=3155119 RepID=UPI0033FA5F57
MYVQVDLDGPGGTLRVSGYGLPVVELLRAPGTRPDSHTPIGTRKAAQLALSIDGEPAEIEPARGRMLRHSYRVDVLTSDGVEYRLVPCGHDYSRLTRDGRRLGRLLCSGDGRVIDRWDTAPTPRDRALGTALAAAFGTGASPWWETVGEIVGEFLP